MEIKMKVFVVEYETAYDNGFDEYYNFDLPVNIKEVEVVHEPKFHSFRNVENNESYSIHSVYTSKEQALDSLHVDCMLRKIKLCEEVILKFKSFVGNLKQGD
jgi:hypothetical protein